MAAVIVAVTVGWWLDNGRKRQQFANLREFAEKAQKEAIILKIKLLQAMDKPTSNCAVDS
jgi:hypothetical protein